MHAIKNEKKFLKHWYKATHVYGAECWQSRNSRDIGWVVKMRMLRRIGIKTKMNRIRSEYIHVKLGVEPLVYKIRESQLTV